MEGDDVPPLQLVYKNITTPVFSVYMLRYSFYSAKDPSVNLALDELITKGELLPLPYLRIWENPRSVVMGLSSRAEEEVNLKEVESQGVPLLRRSSGGGTVYHGRGNLNYTLSVEARPGLGVDFLYDTLLKGIVKALESLGFSPSIANSTDVVIGGYKVSGNAGVISGSRYMLHGTVLVDADLSDMRRLLLIPPLRVRPGVDMVKYRVANLNDLSSRGVDERELAEEILLSFSVLLQERLSHTLPPKELVDQAEVLAERKYRRREFVLSDTPSR